MEDYRSVPGKSTIESSFPVSENDMRQLGLILTEQNYPKDSAPGDSGIPTS
jgi:hypothetical protein